MDYRLLQKRVWIYNECNVAKDCHTTAEAGGTIADVSVNVRVYAFRPLPVQLHVVAHLVEYLIA